MSKTSKKPIIKLYLCNYQEIRNRIVECITILALSDKRKSVKIPKITKNDLKLEYINNKLITKEKNYTTVWRSQDPNEFIIPINEFIELLYKKKIINRFEKLIYWVYWLVKWDNVFFKKTGKIFKCAEREQCNVDKKYYRDFVWILWEIILKKMKFVHKEKPNPIIIQQVGSLYNLFCLNYSKSGKKQRLSLLCWAIQYIIPTTPEIHITKPICMYPSLVLKMCGSVNVLYKKIELNTTRYTSKYNSEIVKFEKHNKANKEMLKFPNKKRKKEPLIERKIQPKQRILTRQQIKEKIRVDKIIRKKKQIDNLNRIKKSQQLELEKKFIQQINERNKPFFIYHRY